MALSDLFKSKDVSTSFEQLTTTSEKLTDWKREPALATLKADFDGSKSSHSAQMAKIDRWVDALEAKFKAKPKNGRSSVQPKLVRRQAEWRYSALTEPFLSSDRLFKVEPRTFEDEDTARNNELILNYQFDTKLNKVKFVDEFVRATVNEGTSIVRLGWQRDFEVVEEEVPVFNYYPVQVEEELQQLQQVIQLKQENPRAFNELEDEALKASVEYTLQTGTPCIAQPIGSQIIKKEQPIINQPVVELVDPHDVYIDPTCEGDINKALFIVVTFETNLAELKRTPGTYKNLKQVAWQEATNSDSDRMGSIDGFHFKDVTRNKLVAHEYWGYYDIQGDGNLVPIVATWIGNVLIRLEENPFPDGKFPFVFVPYLPIPRSVYGEPDAELLEDNQRILGALTRGMIDSLGRSANAQQGFAKGWLDPLNRKRFENGDDYEYNPQQGMGLVEHKYPELPNSAMVMLQLQNQEAEALTGVKAFSGGLSGNTYGNVATGIRGMLDAASKREMAILRRLAKGMGEIGEKLISMNQEFLSDEEQVRITNREYIKIKREELKGHFDIKVDIATAEVDETKSQDLGFMLQTMGPNMSPEMSQMILAEIAELKRMPALAQKIRTYQPEPDPMAEQMKQLELQKLQAEVQKLQAEAVLAQAKAQLDNSKAQDQAYETQDKATGGAYAKSLGLARAQAEGNQNLEITKALTKPRKRDEVPPNIDGAVGFNQFSKLMNAQ